MYMGGGGSGGDYLSSNRETMRTKTSMNLVHVQGCFERRERVGLTYIGQGRSSHRKLHG